MTLARRRSACDSKLAVEGAGRPKSTYFRRRPYRLHRTTPRMVPPEEVWKTFDLFYAYGHPIQSPSLHPQSSGKPITGDGGPGPGRGKRRRKFADHLFALLFRAPVRCVNKLVGLSDRNSWLPGRGLIDEEYPAENRYTTSSTAVQQGLENQAVPSARRRGGLSFRGFFGTYEIRFGRKGVTSASIPSTCAKTNRTPGPSQRGHNGHNGGTDDDDAVTQSGFAILHLANTALRSKKRPGFRVQVCFKYLWPQKRQGPREP